VALRGVSKVRVERLTDFLVDDAEHSVGVPWYRARLIEPCADQNRLLIPADKKPRGGVLPATRDPALKSSWTSRPMT
jgi:hypothetical protein